MAIFLRCEVSGLVRVATRRSIPWGSQLLFDDACAGIQRSHGVRITHHFDLDLGVNLPFALHYGGNCARATARAIAADKRHVSHGGFSVYAPSVSEVPLDATGRVTDDHQVVRIRLAAK